MAYAEKNPKTKKELKTRVAAYLEAKAAGKANADSLAVRAFQPGMGPDLSNHTGKANLEGPHFPKPHSWYATVQMENGVIVKVS